MSIGGGEICFQTGSFAPFRAQSHFTISAPALAKEPAPLEIYGKLPDVDEVVISPSGERLAVLGEFEGHRMVAIFDSQLKFMRGIIADATKVRDVSWIDEEHVLVLTSQTEKLGMQFAADQFEFTLGMILSTDPSLETEVVFANRTKIMNAVFGYYGRRKVDGRWKTYFGEVELGRGSYGSTYFDHGRPGLYEMDVAKNAPRRIDAPAGPGHESSWLVSADGEVAATLDISTDTGRWKIFDKNNHDIADGQNPLGNVGLITLGYDGSTVIFYEEDPETKDNIWFEVPLDGSAPAEEVFSDTAIERIYRNSVTGHFAGYLKKDDELEPVFFDPEMEKTVRMIRAAFKGKNARIYDWTPDFQHAIVHTDGNEDSGSWYLVDVANLSAEFIGADYFEIHADMVGPVSTIAYTAGDGLEMEGILTLPPGKEATDLPVVVLPHGGPAAHDREGFDWWAQAFASRGYAVFQPNFRGSTGYSNAFYKAGKGEWGKKMQTDISDGLQALVDKGVVDPDRACIMGASYGGYAALAGVTLQNGLYRCSVAVAPVADVRLMYRSDLREAGDMRVLKRALLEEFGPTTDFKSISPREQAAQADAPYPADPWTTRHCSPDGAERKNGRRAG